RARPDGRRAEAVLPARTAQRLHLRGDWRGARPRRRDARARLLLRHRLARHADVAACARSLRRAARPRADDDGRVPGVLQHQRRARAGAAEGHSAAVRELRRVVAVHQPAGHGDAAQRLAAHLVDPYRHDRSDGAGCMTPLRVVIAGGGTGGHLYPGIAVARELLRRRPEAQITFAGTARGIEARVVPREGFELEVLRSAGLKGKSIAALARGLALVPLGGFDAWRILSRRTPDVVIGVGGYSSGPVVLAAALRRVPTLVHEQNAVPGLTNRLLARVVGAAAVTFASTAAFFGRRAIVSGNPVRPEFFDRSDAPGEAGGRPRVLIFGGSQGAHAINVAMVAAAPQLAAVPGGVDITHQTGERDLAMVQAGYRSAGLDAAVEPFLYAMD